MIGRTTLLWMLLAAACGFGLFQIKYEVTALEDRLSSLNQKILADQEAIHVLGAEWTFLNDPIRLGDVAQRHLPLMRPITARQIVELDSLPQRNREAPPAPPRFQPTAMIAPELPAPVPAASPAVSKPAAPVKVPGPTPVKVAAPVKIAPIPAPPPELVPIDEEADDPIAGLLAEPPPPVAVKKAHPAKLAAHGKTKPAPAKAKTTAEEEE